jgi:hypothetical protein
MSRTDGGPAFPAEAPNGDRYSGMTLRDWFAGQALVGLLAEGGDRTLDREAELAYECADAMLAAKEVTND